MMRGEKLLSVRRQIRATAVAILVMLSVVVPLLLTPITTNAAEHKTVRVGFYPVANYQEINEDGTYTGFSYDYYMQVQKYTKWNYEFVEASYADCLKMLTSGEIDIMAGLNRTPAREENMIFSNYSFSNSQNKFYAREDNEQLFYESYDTFNGCTVAIMRGMLQNDIDSYSEKHNFHVNVKTYDSLQEMEDALMSGEVDMLCGSSITNETETKIVARMDKIPLYYAVNKEQTDIAEELDEALRRITDNNPDFYTQMSEKYMISGANATATFTREEMRYIESGETVYVIVNANWAPITWYDKDSDRYRGIFVDVLEQIKEYSGLNFEMCTEEEFNKMATDHPEMINNVLAILADDNSWAVQQSVMMTNHVVDSSVVMVTKRGVHQEDLSDDMTIALPNRFYIGYVMRDEIADKNVVYYDTVEDCLDAVNSGRADATYVNELVATYYLSMLEYSELFATGNSGYFENLAFAVNKDSEAPLLSILDKSLLCIGSNEIDQIVIRNSIADQRASLKGLYYSNPTAVVLAVIAIVVTIFCGVFGVHNMRSKKRQAEIELEKEFETSNARTEFFMMISHEIRTPLNAIVGYLKLDAEEHRRNGWDIEYVRRSQNAAHQLTDIAEDMLDYTRIASDNMELHEELFDLKQIIIGVDQNMTLKAAGKKQNYRFTIHNITHEYVVGDRLRIAQILQNLLSNGVKFTAEGGTVEADVREELLEDGRLEIIYTCRDTGKGMPEDFLEKVCAPFNQSDRSYSRTHGGLGLGLYLTKYFVNAMQGTITVESELGKGSCFTVRLPLHRPNSEQILESDVDCSHVRAIVAGTNPEDNKQLKELLKRLRIKCDTITDAEKLVKRIQSRMGGEYEYSLCILDDSVLNTESELIDSVKQLNQELTVFVMTSNTERMDVLRRDESVREVLYKPIFQSVLFDAVMNTFGEYAVEDRKEIVPDLSGLHAMIVEDNAVNADILTKVLKRAHISATICENGQIACDTFAASDESEYQIIFMDIQMPVMDGYEATEQIRRSRGEYGANIPIIAVSANAFAGDIANSMKAGMNEHLSKPVNGVKLYETIEKYCKREKQD